MAEEEEEHEMMWMVDEGEATGGGDQPQVSPEEQVSQLDEELQRVRKELSDVRKELAAKTVQLMRKEQAAVVEKVQEAPANTAAINSETERHMQLLTGQVMQMEELLRQREEELEEAKRLLASQKRALREAAAVQGEREAAERAAAEANRAVAGQAVEDELERLHAELAAAKTRSELQLRARESDLKQLRRELAGVHNDHKQAMAAQEANLAEAWQAEMHSVQESLGQRISEYETEVARLRTQLEDARTNADSTSLLSELAMLNNNKVQVQREFEAFKEMAMQATRKNREEVARLLEENATMHSRLANHKTAELMGAGVHLTRMPSHNLKAVDMLSDQPPPGASSYSAYAYEAAHQALEAHMPQLLRRLERHQRGLLPLLIVGGVVLLILMVSVVRAAASTRSQHSGALCFLAKLGISIGKGCGVPNTAQQDASQELAHLLDRPKRHHDVDVDSIQAMPIDTTTNTAAATAAAAAAVPAAEAAPAAAAPAEAAAAAAVEAAKSAAAGGEGTGGGGGGEVAGAAAAAAVPAAGVEAGKQARAAAGGGKQRRQAAANGAKGVGEGGGKVAGAEGVKVIQGGKVAGAAAGTVAKAGGAARRLKWGGRRQGC